MSEQIPSILVTLTVSNECVAIYYNDLTRIKKHNIKKYKTLKKNFNINKHAFILL